MATSKYPVGSTDSILEYASNSQQRTPAPPPPPSDTTIGTVSIGGSRDVDEGDATTYTASNDGDTTKLSYAWTATGGTAVPSGNSCQVTWGSGPTGKVTVSVTSGDETCTDSPQDKTVNITITPTPPPPPPPTSIGDLTITGDTAPTENTNVTYSIAAGGDAGGLSYKWTITGGNPTGATTGASCEVTWGAAGAGKVDCQVTSSDAGVTDSPKSKSEDITIAVLFKLTSIGSLSFGGPQNPTTGEDASYTCNNDGDADGLSYDWAVTGGTIKGSKTNKKVDLTCGPAGTMQLMCQVTSSDPNCSDTPQQKQSNIPVAMPPASFGTATVTGMQQGFVGEVLEYTAAYDGDVKSPIYRWKINGPSGEIASKGGLNDNTCNVRLTSPGSFEVKCTFDADDFYVADRNKSASVNVQVIQTVEDPEDA